MDRGLVVGGALICASFLVAVGLNQSDNEEPSNAPKKAIVLQAPDSSVPPPPRLECPEPDVTPASPGEEQGSQSCD